MTSRNHAVRNLVAGVRALSLVRFSFRVRLLLCMAQGSNDKRAIDTVFFFFEEQSSNFACTAAGRVLYSMRNARANAAWPTSPSGDSERLSTPLLLRKLDEIAVTPSEFLVQRETRQANRDPGHGPSIYRGEA
jgi:hypothetical protein